MYYTVNVRESAPKQMSFEDLFDIMLNQLPDADPQSAHRSAHVRTYYSKDIPQKLLKGCNADYLIDVLKKFNERWEHLYSDTKKHYRKFFIPKKTGGMREINAPDDELMTCLRELKNLLVKKFGASHHAAAFAYINDRSTIDAVSVHQRNKSKWFLKLDLSKFFPSTTLDFTMSMLSRIYPFGIIMMRKDGEAELRKALSLGFLDGGLPMGTPLSPMLTNLIMIPFDYEFSRYLRSLYKPENNSDGKGRMFVYTRYADDMDISCRIGFRWGEVVHKIREIFMHFGAPYKVNEEKTHYGSVHGKNWMLGVVLNGEHQMTIGHHKKEQFRAILTNYSKDRLAGITWPNDQLQWVNGLLSYYRMVNKSSINNVIKSVGAKHGFDVEAAIKADLYGKG